MYFNIFCDFHFSIFSIDRSHRSHQARLRVAFIFLFPSEKRTIRMKNFVHKNHVAPYLRFPSLFSILWRTINCYLRSAALCSGRIKASFKCVSWLFLAHVQSFCLILKVSHLFVGSFSSPTCWKLSMHSLISVLCDIRENLSTHLYGIVHRVCVVRFFVLNFYLFYKSTISVATLDPCDFLHSFESFTFFFLVPAANFQDLFGKWRYSFIDGILLVICTQLVRKVRFIEFWLHFFFLTAKEVLKTWNTSWKHELTGGWDWAILSQSWNQPLEKLNCTHNFGENENIFIYSN